MRRSLVVSALFAAVVGVACVAWYAVPMAVGQTPGEEKHVVGSVVSTEAENTKVTVKADETGEVIVLSAGWRRRDDGKVERHPEHLRLIAGLEKGDRVDATAKFLEEMWIIQEIKRLDGGEETGADGGDIAALQREIASLREQIVLLRQQIAELKTLVEQLAEK